MMQTYSLKKDGEKQLSANFKVKEFRCKDGSDSIIIDDALVRALQAIRDHFGRAVNISSAYRTKTYNASIGGAANSQHVCGTAADIRIDGETPRDIARWVEGNLFGGEVGGLGLYDYGSGDKSGFVHVDTRSGRAQWIQTKSSAPTGYRVVGSITTDYLGEKAAAPENGASSDARRTLKQGMAGADVLELAKLLDVAGFLPALGFDANLKGAVMAYQAAQGLTADGVVGARTWAALDKEGQ